ncbi:protein FAM221B [Gracilinanus agilis]|uniref:protein FAM221B n=1 Tax=Gracilinanus agilis TaxID=191870 RepID=UPI001CFC6964|nr:protein FAM221B [Gracilinanus agilis]
MEERDSELSPESLEEKTVGDQSHLDIKEPHELKSVACIFGFTITMCIDPKRKFYEHLSPQITRLPRLCGPLPTGYMRPLAPAEKPEVLTVARAMHRDKFGHHVKQLFQWEKDVTLKAIQTGLYIGWRCPHYLWDCYRIGSESKCFCGHLLTQHRMASDISVPCTINGCRCQMFCFIPSRPEEVGEFWLQKRSGFDPKTWRALCRCKHNHEEHSPTGAHACRHRGCQCNFFQSNFLCAACDRRWEEHETFFESEETRRQRGGRTSGADYMPFAEMPVLRNIILPASEFEALEKQSPSGPFGLPGPSGPQPSKPF